jgi:hypothetical protein
MKTHHTIGFGLALLLTTSAASAQQASERASSDYQGSAPSGAVEITTGGGFSHAIGDLSSGRSMSDIAGSGNMVHVGVGYRLDPHLMIGGYVEGSMYQPAEGSFDDRRNFSLASGAQAQYHLLPFERFDPWVGAGIGWRGYWMVDDDLGTGILQGADLVRAQVGVDCHITPTLLIAPTITFTATQFAAEKGPSDSSYHHIEDTRPMSFVSIGMSGRFDVGGEWVRDAKHVAQR